MSNVHTLDENPGGAHAKSARFHAFCHSWNFYMGIVGASQSDAFFCLSFIFLLSILLVIYRAFFGNRIANRCRRCFAPKRADVTSVG